MKRRTNTMTSMQQSPFERSKSHLRPKLRFRSPEKTEEWLASRKKTDYTYSNSVSYSEQLSHSEASDSEYELPIMSRRALGDVTRLSTLSTNTSATKHSSKKSRSRQTVALTPNTSDLYNDSGVMTRSRSRSSRSGTSSVYQENFMNRTRDRLTSTPLKSSPVSRTMTYITEEQSLASQTIPHLYGLDGEDETTDFPESEISCITHTDYTKQRTSSSSSSASSSSSSSIFTFITTWLMQYTVISTTVSVFQKSIQPTIWRLLWTSSSLLYRLVTLNLLGDVWLLTITRNITQRAIAVISTFISSVLHNSSSQSSSSVGAYSGNAASQWESTDMQNSKAASHSERTDMRSRSAANMEGSHGKHNNRYHDKETDELIKTTTTTVVTTVEEKDDRGGCPCLLPCLLLLFLLLGPLYYLCTSGIVPLPFLAKSTSILSKDKDSELFSSPKSVTFLIREELNKFDEKMLSQTEEKEKVPPIVEGCSDCMGRREVIELINSAISKQFDVFQDKFVMYSEHQLQKVERLKTDYENQIADLQNKLNSYNVYAVDRNDLAIGAITRLESEITSLKNDMRTIMFIAPVGEEDNVNIKEYMVENIKKLDSDVMSLDVQLTQLKENLRDLNEMHAKESNKVYSSHENIKEMLQQHKESITANITKLTLYLEVLDSSVSQLKQDLNDLHDSDDSDKTKISSIATNMNNIEIEITELRENVRVLYGHQTITSNQQSSRPEEIIILKGDVSNLKDEVSRLQSKYTEAVAYTYSNQQTLVVVQDTTSKLSTDVEGVVGELDRLKVELAGIQGQDAISVEIAMELNKLQSQINGLDSLVSILQGSVDSLQDNQGSNAESTRQVVDKLNHLENELTVFKVELRNLQHDSRTANPSNRDSEPMHTSQHILQQVNDLEVNITSLKVEMRNFIVQQDTHKGLADDVEQLTTVHNSLQSKVTDLERKTAVLQAELQQYVRDIVTAELGTLSTTTADEISRYQSYVSKLESEITAIRTNVNSIIGVHKNMTNVDYVHKFELLIQGLQEDIQNIRASQRPVTGQLSMNINNVNKLKSDMAKMEATINSLRSDFLVLQESQAAYISLDKLEEFKTSFADVNVLIMDLKTDISNVRGEGDSYKIDVINSMNKLQAEITKLKSDLRTAEITNVEGIELQDGFSGAGVMRSISHLQEELDTIKIEIRNLQLMQNESMIIEKVSKLESVLVLLSSDVTSFGGRIDTIESAIELNESEEPDLIRRLRSDLDAIVTDIKELQRELKLLHSESSAEMFESMQSEILNLKSAVAVLQDGREYAMSSLSVNEDIVNLKGAITQLQTGTDLTALTNLQTEITSLKTDIFELQGFINAGTDTKLDMQSLFSRLDSVETNINVIRATNSEHESSSVQSSGLFSQLNSEIASLKLRSDAVKQLQQDVAVLKADQRISDIQTDVSFLKTEFASIHHLQDDMTSHNMIFSQLQRDMASVKVDRDVISELQSEVASLKQELLLLLARTQSEYWMTNSEHSRTSTENSVLIMSDISGLEREISSIKSDLASLNLKASFALQQDLDSISRRVRNVESDIVSLKSEVITVKSSSQAADADLSSFTLRVQKLNSDLNSMRIDVDTLMHSMKDTTTTRLQEAEAAILALKMSRSADASSVADDGDMVNIMADGTTVKVKKETILNTADGGGGWFSTEDGGQFANDLKNIKVDVNTLKEKHIQILKELHKCCRNETFFTILIKDNIADILNQVLEEDDKIGGWFHDHFVTRDEYRTDIQELRVRLQELIVMRSKYYKKTVNINQTDSHHASFVGDISITEDRIRDIVNDALNMYSADKIGMVDYALESAGGSVISTRCSETHESKTALLSIFGIPLWYSANSARTAIQPDVQPGNCWAFKGTEGYLVIHLSGVVKPTSFSLEHIPKSLSPNGNIDSAPKNFSVWGLDDERTLDGVHLGTYIYDQDGPPLQFFIAENEDAASFPIVELKIHSNHGNIEFTCLYRFRVHGVLQKK